MRKVHQPGDTSLKRLGQLAEVIVHIDADIYALMEVHSEQCLREFNTYFLNDHYLVSLIEGNSDRGIHIAYLIRKGLPFTFEQRTHRRRPIAQLPSGKMIFLSRDIAELRLFKANETSPCLILLAVHLKSKRTEASSDFGGRRQRRQEFELLINTYLTLNRRYHSKVPIIVLGDFNGILRPDDLEEEFEQLYTKTDLRDVLDLLQWTIDERVTQMSFCRQGTLLAEQFDYILLPKTLHSYIDPQNSGVFRFRLKNLSPTPLPKSSLERSDLPSDHFPVVVQLTKTL